MEGINNSINQCLTCAEYPICATESRQCRDRVCSSYFDDNKYAHFKIPSICWNHRTTCKSSTLCYSCMISIRLSKHKLFDRVTDRTAENMLTRDNIKRNEALRREWV